MHYVHVFVCFIHFIFVFNYSIFSVDDTMYTDVHGFMGCHVSQKYQIKLGLILELYELFISFHIFDILFV